MKTIYDMMIEVNKLNVEKGWFESDRSFGDDIALLHSEVSEALESYREGIVQTVLRELDGKPEGVGSELADVFVRLLDTCFRYNIDLEHEFWQKMNFNWTRPHRHSYEKGKIL